MLFQYQWNLPVWRQINEVHALSWNPNGKQLSAAASAIEQYIRGYHR